MKKLLIIIFTTVIVGLVIYKNLNPKIVFESGSIHSWNGDIDYINENDGFIVKGKNRFSGYKIPLWLDFSKSCYSTDEEYDKCSMGMTMSLRKLEDKDLILARQFSTGPRLNGLEVCKTLHQLKDTIQFKDAICPTASTGTSFGPELIGFGWYVVKGYAGGAGSIDVMKYSPYEYVEPSLFYSHSSGELPIEFVALDSETLIVRGHKDPRTVGNYTYDEVSDLEKNKNGDYKYNHECFWSHKNGFYNCKKIK